VAGFLILLAVVFLAARTAGVRFGPVSTTRSHVQYTGGGAGGSSPDTSTGGMNMSGSP
jgi:hypothetical protein